MVRLNTPTSGFWNCTGLAIAILSTGVSWSLIRGNAVEMELAQYKLKTGSALYKVQKASDALEQSANSLHFADPQRKEIISEIEQSQEFLESAEAEIEQETEQLLEEKLADDLHQNNL